MSKAIVFIFEDIENINHPLHLFIEYLRFNLSLVYERQFLLDERGMDLLYNDKLREVIDISVYLTDALIMFYDMKNITNTKFYEIYFNKMRDILLRKELYRVLFRYKRMLIADEEKKYTDSLIRFYDLKPRRLAINPYFAQDIEFKKCILNAFNVGDIEGTTIYLPFQSSIQKYRKIIEYDSILKKIDSIYELRASILSEIDNSWKGIPLNPNLKKVDANNFQSIFIYIVIKGQLDGMFAEVMLIDDILSNNSKLSEKGYFYTLIQSAIEYLINSINEDILDNFEKEYNEIVQKELNSSDSIFIN